jgi:PTH1 family peptidyl-tRNA hydrolase
MFGRNQNTDRRHLKLVVGLGNPGTQYEHTRHNAGYLAVRWLAHERSCTHEWAEKKRLQAVIAKDQTYSTVLAQPTTFMNDSGQAVRKVMDFYEIQPKDITIIHDDADLEVGDIRLSKNVRTGSGHHGIMSVLEHVGPGFSRIRIGIGRPDQPARDISNYVLGRLTRAQHTAIVSGLPKLTDYLNSV